MTVSMRVLSLHVLFERRDELSAAAADGRQIAPTVTVRARKVFRHSFALQRLLQLGYSQ